MLKDATVKSFEISFERIETSVPTHSVGIELSDGRKVQTSIESSDIYWLIQHIAKEKITYSGDL